MTRAEELLGTLLREVTPEPSRDVAYEAVAGRARHHRQRVRGSWAAATAVVLVASAAVAVRGGSTSPEPTGPPPATSATPTRLSTDGSIAFEGISVAIPAGWHRGTPRICGFEDDRTVVTDPSILGFNGARCPAHAQPTTAPLTITLTDLFSWESALGSAEKLTSWQGQPAWISTSIYQGVHEARLALPWLNASVTATGSSAAEALALLQNVSVQPGEDVGIPAAADAIELEVFSPSPLPVSRVYLTDPAAVTTLLDDLSGGLPVDPSAACTGSEQVDSAVLTVRTGDQFRTFDATFGSCNQVVSGAGRAVTVDSQLRDDIYLLLPTAAPPLQTPSSGGCESFFGAANADGAHGQPTERAALAAFLATNPPGFPTDVAAWIEVAQGVFLSGSKELDVVPLDSAAASYVVTSGSNC